MKEPTNEDQPLTTVEQFMGLPHARIARLVGLFYGTADDESTPAGEGSFCKQHIDAIEAALRAGVAPDDPETLYKMHKLAGAAGHAGALMLDHLARAFKEDPAARITLAGVAELRDALRRSRLEMQARVANG